VSARARRRITVACLIVCATLTAVTAALMATGRGSTFIVILFTVEASGVVANAHYLLATRGQR
jgi:hypothetical protein